MKSNHVVIVLALFGLVSLSHATTQIGDIFVAADETHSVYMFELSAELKQKIEEKRSTQKTRVSSSANWDGFYANLELRDDQLYLTHLSIDWREDEEFVKLPIELSNESGVFCDWFTGELRDVTLGKKRRILKVVHFYFEDGVFKDKKIRRKLPWKKSI